MNYTNIRKGINENIKHTIDRSFKLFKEFYFTENFDRYVLGKMLNAS